MESFRKSAKHIFAAMMLLIIATTVVGCRNTAQGAGKDIEHAGEKIQEKTQ